eukprot:CAMPEP_0170524062 /NCGR_PEP_ID=MMETSP0209-20121228/9488_1 /TAXON_ID=665100 ORGANISM="Litonotus pictus, Strain P1" /NCGR_SAMPLE_ID=MMETSP0209 /ASSEMBLY_ACC=CAM_ASM_000301 /LENGTH=381 /DNA_ID=CAMNT_0010812527 /DNA_START=26 /DNA_END=1168 /DNA_ORIENTATION=+
MNTFDKIRMKKDQIIQTYGERVYQILEKHYDIMIQFRQVHLIYKEEKKEEKNEDDSNDEDEGPKEITKEKQNLKEVEDSVFETHPLTKSTKNLYRDLKGNIKFIEFLKELRSDEEITSFSDDLTHMIHSDINKSKMTLEEEQSERDLNLTLKNKIFDMTIQIKEKKKKLEKLSEDKQNFKKNCTANLHDIKNQIENLKKSTVDKMQDLEDKINENLEDANKQHIEDMKNDLANLNKINDMFQNKKQENATEERGLIGELVEEETKLKQIIETYDTTFKENKKNMDDLVRDINYADVTIKNSEAERDKNREQFDLYNKAQKNYEEKVKQDDMDRIMEEYACNWIQNSFRGFMTRKGLRRKYTKLLTGLRKVKPDMTVDKDPK